MYALRINNYTTPQKPVLLKFEDYEAFIKKSNEILKGNPFIIESVYLFSDENELSNLRSIPFILYVFNAIFSLINFKEINFFLFWRTWESKSYNSSISFNFILCNWYFNSVFFFVL